MKSLQVVLFTINDYDNLGVGYLVSMLAKEGFGTKILDPRKSSKILLKSIKTIDPILIGFSVIFLNHISIFTYLVNFLRKNGISCHFTAGGHYASLKYSELFEEIPLLDSIVRFEGERTLPELVRTVNTGGNWKNLSGIAFKEGEKIMVNPLRPVENNLDKYPYPFRSHLREYAFGKRFTPIIAGRGCRFDCSFCNTREFYKQASGPVKRLRKPENVIAEIKYLHREKKCSVFIFHDDDFPLKTKSEMAWIRKFCNEIEIAGLKGKIMWKVNCRPDEIDEEIFKVMKNHGLYLVFIGIEDGTDYGLKKLNKNLDVERIEKSIKILRKLKIGYDYGFMLFQPDTTFGSLYNNIDFLRAITRNGYTPVTFLRLLPLYETRIEKELRKEGRLITIDNMQDYEFNERSMNYYYAFITDCFRDWMMEKDGLVNISKWARNYIAVYEHFNSLQLSEKKLIIKLFSLISSCNIFMLDTMREIAVIFESAQSSINNEVLENFNRNVKSFHEKYKLKIKNAMTDILNLSP